MLYVVTHDFRSDAEQASATSCLQSIARTSCRFGAGIWFIEAAEPGVEIRRALSQILEPGARIVVAMLAGFAAWQEPVEATESWLVGHL